MTYDCTKLDILAQISVHSRRKRVGNDIGRCDRLSLGAGLSATYAMYAEQGNRLLDNAAAETELWAKWP